MKKLFISLAILAGIGLSGCNDSFLEKAPVTDLTEDNAFNSYDNFKAFMWPCYEMFTNNTIRTSFKSYAQDGSYKADLDAGYLEQKYESGYNKFAYQTVANVASGNGWDFKSFIRRINIMLSHIDDSSMTEEQKNHWRAVGYFFHSYWYMELIDRFGAVPWVDQVLQEDSPEVYGPRMDRKEVADKVLERLKWAEENIGNFTSEDGKNTINQDCVRAALSRFTLREGTWRKYHALPNATTYLEECTRASKEVMNKYTTLHPNYEELFNSESLDGINGIILYKEYATSQLCHGLTRMVRTGESQIEATKDAVDSYLCSDGHPIKNSTTYGGDKDVYAQFRNRDYRLYHTVCPPYMVSLASASTTQWKFTDNPSEREYIDLMATISKETYHRLPTSNFKGFITKGQPHFKNVNWGQGWNASQMGFWVWKYYNTHTDASTANGVCTTDAPLFRLGEILLNYAEAMYELGQFDQSIADETINKLRKRAHVADMVLTDITTDFDPERDQDVNPLLWEIRRERRVELMGEGTRLDDLRRWKKGHYVNKQPTGVYLKNASEFNVKVMNGPSNNEGYVYYFEKPIGWLEHYYLNPIPLNQLALNPALEQNPGWENNK